MGFRNLLNVLALQTGGEGLCELLGLVVISDNEGVKVGRASDLELGLVSPLPDLDCGSRVLR